MTTASVRGPRAGRWSAVAVVGAWLLSWELAAGLGLISPLFFPPPSSTARALITMVTDGSLAPDLAATATRFALGFSLGAVTGVLGGFVLGSFRPVHDAVNPLIALVHPLPKISLLPLALMIFGLGNASKIVIIGLSAFFPMVINTTLGVREVGAEYFEVATSYRATGRTVLKRIVVPGSLPAIIAGARLAVNTAMVVTIAIELISTGDGLGSRVWFAWQTLRADNLFATLVVIGAFGLASNWVLERLETTLTPWRQRR
jgi:ABC-type nitrate/sulfonate/bicarbonate transport system permease component